MLKKNEAVEQEPVEKQAFKREKPAAAEMPVKKRGMFARALVFLGRSLVQIALMIAILYGSYAGMQRMLKSAPETPKRPVFQTVFTVDTLIANRQDFQPKLTVYGETTASRSVDLRSLVAGEITSVSPNLKVGQTVSSGEPLVEIDRFNYEGALAEAKASLVESQAKLTEYQARINTEVSKLKRAKEQLVFSQNDLKRIQALRKRKTATQKQVDDRALIVSQRQQSVEQTESLLEIEKARLEQQKAAIGRLEWRVAQAERNLKDTVLVAPFKGVVSASNAETGRLVSANDVVVSMYETDKIDVRFTLTDQRFGRLQADAEGVIGREVEVRWVVGGEVFSYPATIDRIGAQITSNRGGVEVFASIKDNGDNSTLRPGAFVEILVPDRKYVGQFQVPETAIFNGDTVYVVVEGKLESRSVTISGYDGEKAILSSGLKDGDEVLVTRIAEIGEGLRVRKEGDPPRKPQARKNGDAAGAVSFRELPEEEKRKVVEQVLKANNLDRAKWDAMSRQERGPLIRAQMQKRTASAKAAN